MLLRGHKRNREIEKKAVTKKVSRITCRESLLMAEAPRKYAENVAGEGFGVSEGTRTKGTSSGGFLPSIEPWNKSDDTER